MDDNEKSFVEELLDASLRHYASSEPRPGLEGRVMAGVRARQETSRRRSAWAWVIGVAVAAAMITMLLIQWPHRQPAQLPATAKASATVSAPTVAKIAPPVHPPLLRRTPLIVPKGWVDSRPQQFPTPRPLSEQEKLLLAYTQSLESSSAAPASGAIQDSEHDLEIPPIRITAIMIEPLALMGSENDN